MDTSVPPIVAFDRCVAEPLLHALRPGGDLRWLIDHPAVAAVNVDCQLRSDRYRSWMSMYLGLTKVLDVITSTGKTFHLSVHLTHKKSAGFDPAWTKPQPLARLADRRKDIEAYLDKILFPGTVNAKFTNSEGWVQAAISNSTTRGFGVFQREAVPSFQSAPFRDKIVSGFRHGINDALAARTNEPKWWPGVAAHGVIHSLGLEADLLGLDDKGRLLVMEVKPATAVQGISLAPAQSRLYAELFALWLETNPDARDHIIGMVHQRRTLGLPAPEVELPPQASIRVAPVISIGAGKMSTQARPRLEAIHRALNASPSLSARLDPLEVWQHDERGARVDKWSPAL